MRLDNANRSSELDEAHTGPGLALDLVLPVYNEERDLPKSVKTLLDWLPAHLTMSWRITIADNGSTDGTLAVAQALAEEHPEVAVVHITEKGRGRALKQVWLESDADILAYMDIDLSTDLAAFPPLVAAIAERRADVATGSRLAAGSQTRRSLKREIISRGYVLLIRALMRTNFTDAQCGFKAMSRDAAQAILPLVQDNFWFFDTELLVIAEKGGFRVAEVPVMWVEDPDTRVQILRTIAQDLRGLLRLLWSRPWQG
jgi:glycosyltransferase involved in cell wall biosynthesis